MARKKRPADEEREHDKHVEEAEEEIVDAEEEAADAEEAEEEAVDAPADDAAAEEPPHDVDEEPVSLPPRTPIFTIVLVILNFLAAPPFVLLAFMDYAARQQWSHATLMHRLAPLGLPFADEENAASTFSQTRPRLRLDGDVVAAVYKKRARTSVAEPFQPLETIDEPLSFRIKPSQIGETVKSDLFQGLGDPVATLDDEVKRLQGLVPSKIQEAADDYVKAPANADKKKAARNILMRLASSTKQIEDLDARINAADGAALDELLKDAVQRRMLIDLMAPMNVVRPGAFEKYDVEKVVAMEKGNYVVSLDMLNDLLKNRFAEAVDSKRDDIDRRHALALIMVGVARLKAPDAKEPLFGDKALERAQVVSGLYEFALAAGNYVRALRVLEDRILFAIEVDREGYVVRDAKGATRTNGFVGEHANDIMRLKKVAAEIEFTKKRIADLEVQRKRYQKQYDERLMLLTEVGKSLVAARGETAKLLEELRLLQEELFAAQLQLSDAAERNARLEMQIRQAENRLLKGGDK